MCVVLSPIYTCFFVDSTARNNIVLGAMTKWQLVVGDRSPNRRVTTANHNKGTQLTILKLLSSIKELTIANIMWRTLSHQ